MQVYLKEDYSVLEAIDFFSSLSEIDITSIPKNVEEDTLHPHRWLIPNLEEKNRQIIFYCTKSVLAYLKQIAEHKEMLQERQVHLGLIAMKDLLSEAFEKIKKFTSLLKSENNQKEYKQIFELFTSEIEPYLSPETSQDNIETQLGIQIENLIGIQKKGILDVEDVKSDRSYELFYLKKEDKKPFYDYEIIRRLKLLYDVDFAIEETSPFLRIRALHDQEMAYRAESILQSASNLIEIFYKESSRIKGNSLVAAVHKALMALMLSANPMNLQSTEKRTSQYFSDFHFYLREGLNTPEYKKITTSNIAGYSSWIIPLLHKLCSTYFIAATDQKEMAKLIHKLLQHQDKSAFLKDLASEDQEFRLMLDKYPHGPIRRVIQAFISGEIQQGWDPLAQGNSPSLMYKFHTNGRQTSVIRLPAPIHQDNINHAEVVKEFSKFLKIGVIAERGERFLFVNLQDRTSWEEHARSEALESLAENEEFQRTFSLINLPKQTDFYFQKDSYANIEDSCLFKGQLLEQVEGGELCGFYGVSAYLGFAKDLIEVIHQVFFENKAKINLQERKDFIDIFYFFIIAKQVEEVEPEYMSISCKDSVDTGAIATAGFFFCFKAISSKEPLSKKEEEHLLWMLYAPALFYRERAVQQEEMDRFLSTMNRIENKKSHIEPIKNLYKPNFFETIECI